MQARRPLLVSGEDVTFGHNAHIGACSVEHRRLIGMGATVMDGAVVRSDRIWEGCPAGKFREMRAEEEAYFRMGKEVYGGCARDHLAAAGRC